jgi:hypothetical protein
MSLVQLRLTGKRIAPMTMEHEFSAEVVELGINPTKYSQ